MKKTTISITIDSDLPTQIKAKNITNISSTINQFLRNLTQLNNNIPEEEKQLVAEIKDLEEEIQQIMTNYTQRIEHLTAQLSARQNALEQKRIRDKKEMAEFMKRAKSKSQEIRASGIMSEIMQ